MTASQLMLALVVTAITALGTLPAQADIFKKVDANGIVHLSDRPVGPGWTLLYKGGKRVKPSRAQFAPQRAKVNQARYTPLINSMAHRFRLDRDLVHAVIRAESAYDPNAVSRAGAVGLMQLMPATARRYGVNDRRNPRQNVSAGVRHLRDLLIEFNDVALALAAYNAGSTAVNKYGRKVPPYPETRTYVRRVLAYYRQRRS